MPPATEAPVLEQIYINPGNDPVNFPAHPGSDKAMVRLIPFRHRSRYPGEPFFLKGPINHYNQFVKAGQLQPFRDPLPPDTASNGFQDGPKNFTGLDQTILAKVREVMLGNADDDILSAYQFVLSVRAGKSGSIHPDLQVYEPKLSALGRGLANADRMFATVKKNAELARDAADTGDAAVTQAGEHPLRSSQPIQKLPDVPFVPAKPELQSSEPPAGDTETSGIANKNVGGARNKMPQPRPQ